jgi:hypothetical protein
MTVLESSNIKEIERETRELLPFRADAIVDGKLGGKHWFAALLDEAAVRRQRKYASAARIQRCKSSAAAHTRHLKAAS